MGSNKKIIEIKNETEKTFSYRKGAVNIGIKVNVTELSDLRDIVEQCLKDVTEALNENKTQRQSEVSEEDVVEDGEIDQRSRLSI